MTNLEKVAQEDERTQKIARIGFRAAVSLVVLIAAVPLLALTGCDYSIGYSAAPLIPATAQAQPATICDDIDC